MQQYNNQFLNYRICSDILRLYSLEIIENVSIMTDDCCVSHAGQMKTL